MNRIKIILLLLMLGCISIAGCAEKKPAEDQGELVMNERLSEKSGSLYCWKSLRAYKKMVR